MKKMLICLAIAVGTFWGSAYAGGNTCIGNADCGTTNNYNSTTNSQGGQGGAGGTGIGVGVGIASAAAGASATTIVGVGNENRVGVTVSPDIRNTNTALGGSAHQGQLQGQKQGQEQAAIAVSEGSKASSTSSSGGGAASSGGNTLTVNTQYAAPNMREMVPNLALGGLYPSAPCMGTSNIGGTGPGISLGFGTSWKDDDCGARETARSFAGLGLTADAIAVLCASQYAKAAPSCQKAEAAKQAAGQPDQKRRTSDEPVRTSLRVEQGGCVADPIVASRLGVAACR